MRGLIFRPMHNTPPKKDVTGAFQPEAKTFLKHHGGDIHVFDNHNTPAKCKTFVYDKLSRSGKLDYVAFFCHGWKTGIQAGFNNADIPQLATFLRDSLRDAEIDNEIAGHVILYCCSTGGDKQSNLSSPGTGDGSFADRLRDELCKAGLRRGRVVAHTTVAHCTMNPHVLFFDGLDSPVGGVGGIAPVTPKHVLWKKWKAALNPPKGAAPSTLRFRFPFMSVAEIHEELLNKHIP